MDGIASTVETALLTAVREQLGEDPIRRPVLVTHFMSLRRVLENASSPDQGIISDVKYRTLLSAQAEALEGVTDQVDEAQEIRRSSRNLTGQQGFGPTSFYSAATLQKGMSTSLWLVPQQPVPENRHEIRCV